MNLNRLDVPLFTEDQTQKQCKKQTPNYIAPNKQKGVKQVGFRTKDDVYVRGNCLVNKTPLDGDYKFDSYDTYDNTAFIITNTMTYNVLLSDISLIPKL
jgi:hypothetical protein